jgi:hypothetical protein
VRANILVSDDTHDLEKDFMELGGKSLKMAYC